MKNTITVDLVRDLLDYNVGTGIFVWKERPESLFSSASVAKMWNKQRAGKVAGCVNLEGYVVISIGRTQIKAHRLAWLYVNGQWPACDVDHINGNRSDNRFDNLREATASINAQNLRAPRSNNRLGALGVVWDKARQKYRAQIKVNGRLKNVGRFDTKEAAHAAYVEAKRKLHEGCTL